MSEDSPISPPGELLVYEAPDGGVWVNVRLEQETVRLTQQQMAELFGRERSVATKHIRNAFKEGDQKSNVQDSHIAGSDNPVGFYNLDAILSVGYRVNSKRGTQSASGSPGPCTTTCCAATR